MRTILIRLMDSKWWRERVLGEQFVSVERAHELFCRREMERHPWERDERWPGMEQPHQPIGVSVQRFDLSKKPLFQPQRRAS